MRPWNAEIDPDPLKVEVFDRLKEGETKEFIEALMQCCGVIEELGGLPRFTLDAPGKAELQAFQKRVYRDVFTTDTPKFEQPGKHEPGASVPVARFHPGYRTKIASLWEETLAAIDKKKGGKGATSAASGAGAPAPAVAAQAGSSASAASGAGLAAAAAAAPAEAGSSAASGAVPAKAMPKPRADTPYRDVREVEASAASGAGAPKAKAQAPRAPSRHRRHRGAEAQWGGWAGWVWTASGWQWGADAYEVDTCPLPDPEGDREFATILLMVVGVLCILLACCSVAVCCAGYYTCRSRRHASVHMGAKVGGSSSARKGAGGDRVVSRGIAARERTPSAQRDRATSSLVESEEVTNVSGIVSVTSDAAPASAPSVDIDARASTFVDDVVPPPPQGIEDGDDASFVEAEQPAAYLLYEQRGLLPHDAQLLRLA